MIRTGIDRGTHESTNRLSRSTLCLKNDIEVKVSKNSSPTLQKIEIVFSEIPVFQCCSGKCYVLIVKGQAKHTNALCGENAEISNANVVL
jgi:hypothetical protein